MRAVADRLLRHRDLGDVVRLALPAIATSLLQTLVFLVDRLMLGHHSETALAAMQTAGPVVWSVFSVFGAFTVGTVAVVGRAFGSGDRGVATSAARGSYLLALGIGTAVAIASTALVEPVLDLLAGGEDPAVRAVSLSYLHIALPAMPAFFVGLTGISILQASGDTRTPLTIGVVTNVVNLVGNAILVFGTFGAPRLGARGSAISSVAAAVLESVLGLAFLLRHDARVSLRASPPADALAGARRVLRVATGSWGEKVLYHSAYLAFVRFVVGLGAAAMAANQALISIESISFLTADGCAVAAGALVAQRLGAGDVRRARASGWLAAALCAVILGACGVVFVSIPSLLVRAFRDDPAVVAAGVNALRVAAIAQVPMAIGVVLGQAIRGAGATREALLVSLAGAVAVRLAATWVFVDALHWGLAGVWLGSTSDWLCRAVVYTWRFRAGAWTRTRV